MALAICRDCEERVSQDAWRCPHCGAPRPAVRYGEGLRRRVPIRWVLFTSIALVIGLSFSVVVLDKCGSAPSDQQKDRVRPVTDKQQQAHTTVSKVPAAPTPENGQLSRCLSENQTLKRKLDQQRASFLLTVRQTLNDQSPGLWACDAAAYRVVQERQLPNSGLGTVVDELNELHGSWGAPRLVLIRHDCDTAFVVVDGSQRLTEGMGTTGAQCFLAAATFSLTSVPEVSRVMFDFEEGSHASPGRYGRIDFLEMFAFN